MRKVLIISAVAALLASCGGPEGSYEDDEGNRVEYDVDASGGASEYRITGEDGEEMVINSGTDVAVNLPDGYSVFPGANVVTNTTVTQADGQGSMIIMTSDASAEEIANFYRQQAEAANVEIRMEMNSNGSVLLGGEGPNGETFSINATPSDSGTTAQLLVGKAND